MPVAAGATLEEALGGGEDYELLVVADREASATLSPGSSGGLRPLLPLGTVVRDPAERLLGGEVPRASVGSTVWVTRDPRSRAVGLL